ncbi:hypothetical protein ACFSY7_20210, partial [Kurthia populi]
VIPNLRIKIEKVMSNSTSPSLLKTGISTYVPASFLLQDEDKYKEKVTIHKNVQTGRGFQ